VERLPFADATFDRIVAVDAFHHFADQRAAIAEMWRVLSPRGRLVIEEMNIDTLRIKVVAFAERVALMQSCFYSPRAMGQMLQAAGAQVEIHSDRAATVWVVAHKAVL
jgi:ubiquinone/menaquinone biosynthesis C-methylase UbiE